MDYMGNLWLFLVLLFGIIIVPGLDMLFVMANALTNGRSAGFAATAGIMAGGAVHTLYGALGAGLIARWLPWLFAPMLVAGAAYMIWIGYTLMRSSITVDAVGRSDSRSLRTAFRQGALTCLINPKAYMFVLAVYPQFVRPEYGPVWQQALVMGVMTALMQLLVYGAVALAAGRSRDALIANPAATILVGRGAGLLLVVAAAVMLWQSIGSHFA